MQVRLISTAIQRLCAQLDDAIDDTAEGQVALWPVLQSLGIDMQVGSVKQNMLYVKSPSVFAVRRIVDRT